MKISELSIENREILAKKFIEEVILPQWRQLQQWHNLTKQTPQIDFGYLAQHLVTLISGIPGKGQRGKGDDLLDGSDVKSASSLDASDIPRWNNVNCGKYSEIDLKNKLDQMPFLLFVLFDTTTRGGSILRCRVWSVRTKEDEAFRTVALGWARDNDKLSMKRRNLQLHPPIWEKAEKNITTNTYGNLQLPLIYHSEQLDIPGILVMETKLYKPELMENGLSIYLERV